MLSCLIIILKIHKSYYTSITFKQIYQFPDCDSDEDEEFKQQDKELKACVPFAVIGSSTVLEVAGRKVRGRQYPWGVVEGARHNFTLISTSEQRKGSVRRCFHIYFAINAYYLSNLRVKLYEGNERATLQVNCKSVKMSSAR